MKKESVIILSSALALAVFTGAFLVVKNQIGKLKKYCYAVKGFRINSFTRKKMSITLKVLFENKSDIGFWVKGYDLKTYIDNKYVATVKSVKKEYIKANGVSDLLLEIDFTPSEKFSFQDLMRILGYYLTDKEKLKLSLKGHVTGSHKGFSKEMPLNLSFNFKELLESEKPEVKCNI